MRCGLPQWDYTVENALASLDSQWLGKRRSNNPVLGIAPVSRGDLAARYLRELVGEDVAATNNIRLSLDRNHRYNLDYLLSQWHACLPR